MQWNLAGMVPGRAVCVLVAVLLLTIGNARAQGSVAEDRAALEALYNATGGANWTGNTNWLSSDPLGSWYGVITDSDGRVSQVGLSQNQLTGEIPAELGQLSNLQSLNLYSNQLTGEIPAELGYLTTLWALILRDNQLTGKIPAELGQLFSLGALFLDENQLTGEIPAELGQLSNLEQLYLDENRLTGEIPAELGQLSDLLWLRLDKNQLTGDIPSELAQLSNLETLGLGGNQLTGEIPAELGQLSNLQRLYLDGNQLTGEIPSALGNLANLLRLRLHDNELSGEIPVELANLPTLVELSLWGNPLTGMIPAGLAAAQERGALRVFYNATGGANWTDKTNWLSGGGPSTWYGVSTDVEGRVEELRLSSNGLTGTLGAELGALTQLTGLYLNDNRLTGRVPAELESLPQLQVLDIRNTGLCVKRGTSLHTWLATINFQGAFCATRRFPPSPPPPPGPSAPGAPRNLTVVGGIGKVVLSWEAPENDGGAAITDYEYRIDRSPPWISTGSTDTTHTVSGLDSGTTYLFEVRAVNRVGSGSASNRVEAAPKAPEVLDFSHFVNGEGITSDLVFVNVGTRPVRPTLYFYGTEGSPIAAESVVDIAEDLEVAEDGALTVGTEMEPLGELTVSTHGREALVTGSVKVVSEGPLGGMLRFELPHIGQAVVRAGTPLGEAVFPVRRQQGGINTGVAIHNLESTETLVDCQLLREGVLVDAVSIPLAANGQTSWSIDQAFPAADTSDFAGSVRCDAEGRARFSAIALEMDSGTRIFTTLPVLEVYRAFANTATEATTLDFAHFANGESILSELVFVNLETRPSRPRISPFHAAIPPTRPVIYFYDPEGNPIAPETVVDTRGDLEVTEDGGLTVRTEMEPLGELAVSTHGRGPVVTGSVKVLSEGHMGGMLRFDLPHVGQAVVGASAATSDVIFPVRRRQGGITTGVAIHNLESTETRVDCELLREGVLVDAVSIPLAANGQTSWSIDQAFTAADTSEFSGSVRCTAVGDGEFTAAALEMDSGTRIFITLPVLEVEKRMSQD
ncbi:MAG: fibronectin type III domain-containing protein [Acidobacteriota bacterium]|nr:fibronectin type III domain-containing protein [Acidobacteriota bacterium]